MKNEKTRGERGACSHYILVIEVLAVSYSVIVYALHCVFRIALEFHVISGRNPYTATQEMSPAITLFALPHVTKHRLSNNWTADKAL